MWKSAYSCSHYKRESILMGSWSLWSARTSWYKFFSFWWRRISFPTYSLIRPCIEECFCYSCFLWRCSYNGFNQQRWSILFWWRKLRVTWTWRNHKSSSWCWSMSFYARTLKDRRTEKWVHYQCELWRFSLNGSNQARSCLCLGRSYLWTTRVWRFKESTLKLRWKNLLAYSMKSQSPWEEENHWDFLWRSSLPCFVW